MDKCPYCKSEEYYTKEYAKGPVTNYARFDGEEADNTDLHEGLAYTLKSKYAWCANCHKRLFKLGGADHGR